MQQLENDRDKVLANEKIPLAHAADAKPSSSSSSSSSTTKGGGGAAVFWEAQSAAKKKRSLKRQKQNETLEKASPNDAYANLSIDC